MMIVKFIDPADNTAKMMKCTSVEFMQFAGTCLLVNSREGRSIRVAIKQLTCIVEDK